MIKFFQVFSLIFIFYFAMGVSGFSTRYVFCAEQTESLAESSEKAELPTPAADGAETVFVQDTAKSEEKIDQKMLPGGEPEERAPGQGDERQDNSAENAEGPNKVNDATQSPDVPLETGTETREAEKQNVVVVSGTVEKGDTVGKILEKNSDQGVQSYLSATKQIFALRSFRAGQPYKIITDSTTGRLKRFEYEIDSGRRLVVEGLENPVARLEMVEYTTSLTVVEAMIDDNLFQAVADIGESPQLALRLADLFGAEINFIRDLQKGDSFAVLLEKRNREDKYAGYGRILAARFVNKGKVFEAFLFRDGGERAQHYNRKGESLRKTLLQAPLAFTRVTSRFSLNRLHPVLGEHRPHFGVDYAAPTGTPVKAVGDGLVTSKGWAGGFGNQLVVKHSAGLESLYAHLSGYARGVGVGAAVRQGQVIAFVGSTGLATGPHLDFRLRHNGRFIDPLKAVNVNPRGEPVSARNRQDFEKILLQEQALLDGGKMPDTYTVNSLVPEYIVLDTLRPEKVEKEKARPSGKASRGQARRRG